MTDSLLLDGLYELIGGATNPEYRLMPSSDALGQPAPDTALIAGTLLDGDRVTGLRSANRNVTLPIMVTGTSRSDIAVKVNRLLQVVDAQSKSSFTLTWQPDGGLPVIFDCYRGGYTRERIITREAQLVTVVTLAFQANPFGRSDVINSISAVSPQLQIDSMDATTPPTGATRDTTNKYEGTASASTAAVRHSFAVFGGTQYSYSSANALRTITAVDLSSFPSVGVRVRWVAPVVGSAWSCTVTLYLGDGSNTGSVTTGFAVAGGSTAWQLVTFPLASLVPVAGTLNLTAVTQWQLLFGTARKTLTTAPTASPNPVNYDDLRAYPAASTAVSTPEGAVVTIPAVAGSARSPLAVSADRGGSALADLLVHHPPIWQDLDAQILAQLVTNTVTIAAANNTFRGTYTLWLLLGTLGSGTRTVTVTLTHKQGATTLATATLVRTYSATPGHGIAIGEVTLPLKDVPAENVADTLVIAVSSTGGTADTFTDVALCDTSGETVWIGSPPASSLGVYVDEPDPATECPAVYASTTTDRTAAVSVLGDANTRFGGGGLFVVPGDNRLLTASSSGTPNLVASYYDRWLDERG